MTSENVGYRQAQLERRWLRVFSVLDEAQARLYAAEKALELGRGGVSRVARLTGMSRDRIHRGVADLENPAAMTRLQEGQLRRRGGGRKRADVLYPGIRARLDEILEETTAGDPMSHLRWTCKSMRAIAGELSREALPVSWMTVARYLHEQDYSLQGNVKMDEGRQHVDRDGQFRYINRLVDEFMKSGDPVISVDGKKKEQVGDFCSPGRQWRKKGNPRKVSAYDFPSLAKGKVLPYGAYDVAENKGFVAVGVTHDTSAFAVESIRRWWYRLGRKTYPKAKRLLMCADGGGSNGYRVKGWKVHLQRLADELGVPLTVCHYPPATSKWNRIEHRLFSFISLHWRGEPLVSYHTVIQLIRSTTTETGLEVKAEMDWSEYPTGVKYDATQMSVLNLTRHDYHGDWNYTIRPNGKA